MNNDSHQGTHNGGLPYERGFTLIEVATALIILGLTCSSVLIVMNRNMQSTYDVTMRLRALEVAREHLEEILVSPTVQEMTETGTTETAPPIEWENTIETFYSPVNGQTWARARCVAGYEDMEGHMQSLELEHWLTAVSDAQSQALENLNSEGPASFDTLSEAADYAGVPEETISTWIDNGMALTEDGRYLKENLDLFLLNDGHPTPEEIAQQPTTVGTESDMSDGTSETFPEEATGLDLPGEQSGSERAR